MSIEQRQQQQLTLPNASSGQISDNLFYLAYRNHGQSTPLIFTAILLNCVGLPGFLLNFSVLLVTWRHRSLHGSAHFLLAMSSLFEMGHEAGHLLFLWMALGGQNFVPYRQAFWLLCVPIFCVGGIFASMFSTGLDRLLCVLLPHRHAALPLPLYLAGHCLLSAGVCLWLWLQFLSCAQLYADYPVTGYISDMIIGRCAPAYTYSSLAFNLGTILLYMVVGLLIRVQSSQISQQSQQQNTNRRLFRSLATIIVANIGGYFYVSIARAFLLPLLQLDSVAQWYVTSYNGILLNVSAAINAPVLYMLSKDYRAAFKAELAKIPRFKISLVQRQVAPLKGVGHTQQSVQVTSSVRSRQPPQQQEHRLSQQPEMGT